jgi:hypothetical protein
LGGAILSGAPRSAKKLDLPRLEKIEALRRDIENLPLERVVILVARGDEAELISWARPAAELLRLLASRKVKLIVMDRTSTPRAGALVDRMVELAGLKARDRISAGKDTLAMPCLTAIVAGRRTPEYCPFDKPLRDRLQRMGGFGLAVLVGRDLDGEVDDLQLYALRTVLVSFRRPLTEKAEKGIEVQLKSLSDLWLVSPEAGRLSGTLAGKIAPPKTE